MLTAMPLVQGKIALGAGTYTLSGSKLIHCEEDGTINVIFKDGTTYDGLNMMIGDDRIGGPTVTAIEVTSGTFSIG